LNSQTCPIGPKRGFTLIELLIVVAIIAILAAIAVPNFLEAQTRSKVSRAHADMRSLATAVESYTVDFNGPPFRRNTTVPPSGTGAEVPLSSNRLEQMSVITTPISYITSLPIDPFETRLRAPNNVIDYWDPQQVAWTINQFYPFQRSKQISPKEAPWILVCIGPDGYMGPIFFQVFGWPMDSERRMRGSMYMPYDPTNGTLSKGNIYRSGTRNVEDTGRFLMHRFFNR
jgi:prepilin-type N-terminal cleavage/methylation domain-containing protein